MRLINLPAILVVDKVEFKLNRSLYVSCVSADTDWNIYTQLIPAAVAY